MARMGTLQIDSVNVFARSHYMPLFSRLGAYDTTALDRLLFARRAPYVEYLAHVAAFIPASDWSLFRFRMDDMRARYGARPDGWYQSHRHIVDWVRAELAARGPLRPAQIEHDAKETRRGPWWDWDVVKHALEHLWMFGEVAIAGPPRVRAALRARGGCDPRRGARDRRCRGPTRSASSSGGRRSPTAWPRHPTSRTTGG